MATYIANVPFSSSTAANYKAWAMSFGQALTAFGWLPQSGHGEVVWSNVVAAPGSATVLGAVNNYMFQGAFVGGTTYLNNGVNTSTNNVDYVTYGGLTYVHITASSSLSTTPDADTTNWAPFNFEIWKSNGPMSSTFPVYLKLAYIQNATGNAPGMLIGVGRGVDANGNLTGAFPIANGPPVQTVKAGPSSSANSSNFEMDFSGDADNFRVIPWRTYGSGAACVQPFVIERPVTASGGSNSDAFVYIAHHFSQGGTNAGCSCIGLKLSLGGGTPMVDTARWIGSIAVSAGSLTCFGATPAMPVYPVVGYLANPLLGVMTFQRTDVAEGSIVPVWAYGAVHNYIVTSTNLAITASPNGINSGQAVGILWE